MSPDGLLGVMPVALAVLALVPLASDTSWIPGRAIPTVVGVITVATLVEIGLRAMVRRPQPLGGTGELAVDDALRSTALHRAAGAGLAASARWTGTGGCSPAC